MVIWAAAISAQSPSGQERMRILDMKIMLACNETRVSVYSLIFIFSKRTMLYIAARASGRSERHLLFRRQKSVVEEIKSRLPTGYHPLKSIDATAARTGRVRTAVNCSMLSNCRVVFVKIFEHSCPSSTMPRAYSSFLPLFWHCLLHPRHK